MSSFVTAKEARAYAQRSLELTHGDKTEDELLQRVWNLAKDVIRLTYRLEGDGTATPAETVARAQVCQDRVPPSDLTYINQTIATVRWHDPAKTGNWWVGAAHALADEVESLRTLLSECRLTAELLARDLEEAESGT